MGQTISKIWKYLRQKVSRETPGTPLDDQHAHQQLQQSHYIDVPDLHTHVSKPFRVTSSIPHDVTPPVPSVVLDLNNNEYHKVAKNKEKKCFDKEVLPPIVEKQIVVKQEVSKKVPCVLKETIVKSIGPYTSMQKILLVGEGDFSFSASLAVAFGSASNIIATSLNSQAFLNQNYRQFRINKLRLKTGGGTVIHGIDVTTMVREPVVGGLKFDRIIFNFPHSGAFGRTDSDLRKHKELVRGFLRNAKKMIDEDGEIHITHKSSAYSRQWNVPKIGSDQGLILNQETDFEPSIYPGYHTKSGFGGDKNFHNTPCKTYKFVLLPK